MNIIKQEIHLKDGLEIKNIRRGKGPRNVFIYADLYMHGKLHIAATLDYIVNVIELNRTDLIK